MNSKAATVLLTGAAAGALVGFLIALEKGLITGKKLSARNQGLANVLTGEVITYIEKFASEFMADDDEAEGSKRNGSKAKEYAEEKEK